MREMNRSGYLCLRQLHLRCRSIHQTLRHSLSSSVCQSRDSFGKGFDLVCFLIREAQLTGPHNTLGLARIAGPDDRASHGRMVQCPGDCYLSRRPIVAPGNLLQAFSQRQIV